MQTLLLALTLLTSPQAAELAGITMPDEAAASDGTKLVLNGLGLREKYWIDIYVGGLYLTGKSSDAAGIVSQDKHKRVVMHFIYRKVTQKQMLETFEEGFAKAGLTEKLSAEMATLRAMIDRDILRNEKVIIEYIPGKGTSFTISGENKGVIAGTDFMKGIFSVFLGPKPASEPLKKGMLGG
jgi:hypothetical protein